MPTTYTACDACHALYFAPVESCRACGHPDMTTLEDEDAVQDWLDRLVAQAVAAAAGLADPIPADEFGPLIGAAHVHSGQYGPVYWEITSPYAADISGWVEMHDDEDRSVLTASTAPTTVAVIVIDD